MTDTNSQRKRKVGFGALVVAMGLLAALAWAHSHFQSTLAMAFSTPLSESRDSQGPCGNTLQALVDRAPAGSVVKVPPCVYREKVTINKSLTLIAQPGAEIRGSDIWSTGWTRSAGEWLHAGMPSMPSNNPKCRKFPDGTRSPRCAWREQVFYDGKPLLHVEANPTNGQFSVANGTLVIADDPSGHTVEVTIRDRWIVIKSDRVTIQGFTMRHCANAAQEGAIDSMADNSEISIIENILTEAHAAAIRLRGGSHSQILRNDIGRNGQLGITLARVTDSLVQGNRIHENNTEDFGMGWEAGGLKAAPRISGLTIDGNEVYLNRGPGLWCDGDCQNVTYSNNRIYDNEAEGIEYEISHGARIFGNVVWNNGWGDNEWGFGAGILIQNSEGSEVYDNVLAWNAKGISVVEQPRKDESVRHPVTGVYVHNNTIVMRSGPDQIALAWMTDFNSSLFDPNSNNRADANAYGFSGLEETGSGNRFAWGRKKFGRLADFNSTPGGGTGRYLSLAEQNKILSAAGIPLSPPPPPPFLRSR